MKKQILFAGLIALSCLGLQAPAQADPFDWHKKYDIDHDGRWNREEYAAAQREWEMAHHHKPMSEADLRRYYDKLDRDRDGYLSAEEARRAHHW